MDAKRNHATGVANSLTKGRSLTKRLSLITGLTEAKEHSFTERRSYPERRSNFDSYTKEKRSYSYGYTKERRIHIEHNSYTNIQSHIKNKNNSHPSYDIVVVGGGIQGAGVLQAAQAAGYNTLALEKSGWAAGTSSKSSKLIHGGITLPAKRRIFTG